MISSRAIELLQSLNEDEFRKFGLFVRSPYFNKEKIQAKFYDAIKKYYPGFDQRGFNKETIFAKIFPSKKYNDGVIRNILSTTLHLAENFLAHNKLETDDFYLLYNTISELNRRKQNKLFERKADAISSILQNEDIFDGEFFYKRFQLAEEIRKFNDRQKSTLDVKKEDLTKISDHLTISFMIKILRIHIYIASTNKYMFKYEHNKILMDGIEQQIVLNYDTYKKHIYLIYYFNFYMLIKTREEKYFFDLHGLFKQYYSKLNRIDIKDTFTILANYSYLKINNGELKFLKHQFEIYRQNIETGFYKGERGFLSHILFINVVVTGLEAGESEWIRDFIGKYGTDLDPVNRGNTVIFCNAFYQFWNKNYSEALNLASAVKTDDLSYKHQIKSLYLKIYFELNETESFYSHVDSYKHFISAGKNTGEQIRPQINSYINYSKKLFDLKCGADFTDVDTAMLKNEIINDKALINKPWLLRKLEELKANA